MKLKFCLLLAVLIGSCTLSVAQNTASPTVIQSGTRASLNLNGSWQILPISGLTFTYPPPAQGWKAEEVPQRRSSAIVPIRGPYTPLIAELLNAEGTDFKRKDGMAAWYRREFVLPPLSLVGKRAILHFGGLAYRSETWVNGTKVGTSVSGLLPIDYDVTSLLHPNGKNQIEIGLAGVEALFDLKAKTYTAPSSGVMAGIWDDVELQLVPEVTISDIFVKTFVGARRLEVETTVSNTGKVARLVQPQISVVDSQGVAQTSLQSEPFTVGPNQQKTVVLKKDWIAPHLWSPENPSLYQAKVELQSGGTTLDRQDQRFGFREFEIRGRDFYLNGKRTVLLRNSFLTEMVATPEQALSELRRNIGQPYNTARLHLGFNNEVIINAADEMGLMINPEFSWYHNDKFLAEKSALWMPNTLEYMRGFIRRHRNHPSIVIWTLTNEHFWGNTEPQMMQIADKVIETVRSLDTTRPLDGDAEASWGGRLPIINIHYPDGAGPLRKKYINSGYLMPNDLYWLKDTGINESWPNNKFVWDRPLIIGEYWDPSSISTEERTSFMGESPFDFEKWRQQDIQGLDRQQSDYIDYLKRATDVYRLQGVAGLNPWAGDRQEIMPQIAVRPLDFHPNFFGGKTGTRKVVVFNDSGVSYPQMNLQCRLTINGVTVWDKNIKSQVESGQKSVIDVPIDCPEVNETTKATLSVRLRYERGGRWTQLSRHEETIYVLPATRVTASDFKGVVLLDSVGTTATALRQMGAQVAAKTTLSDADLQPANLLIVGAGTEATPFRAAIGAFVRRGGRLVLLNQNNGVPLLPELGQTDDTHVATRSWIRSAGHPILADVEEAQLSYWKPDHLVSTLTLQKPNGGKSKAVVDAGGRFGLNWAPLLETAVGNGLVLQSQFNLVDRVEQEPLAGQLLLAMLRYSQNYKSPALQPLRVLVGKNDALNQVLAACSIVTSPGLNGQGPVLLDASYSPSADEISRLKNYVEAGGKLWLHGFNSTNIAAIANLFPFKPQLVKYDATVQSAVRRSDDPLMANISSQEFYWTRLSAGRTGDFYGQGQPTAKLGGEVLVLPSLSAGQRLIEPGLLVKVPSGKGVMLFDTLLWENAYGTEAEKVTRLLTSLALNMGADVQRQVEKNYAYTHADLTKQANMGFYDPIAGDGKGGWTDQGENDMRFFLINHTGIVDNMAVMESEFPAMATFAGRPFSLIDPKKNQGRSVITLRGQQHGPTMPSQVADIPFGHKAEKLWFLHTSCWAVSNTQNQEIGRYIIHYTDGTQSAFPLRYGLELSDWWNPKPLNNAKVAWTGKNGVHSPIGIYVSEWTNPEPGKTIASVDVVGDKSEAQIVLLGISGGVETIETESPTYKPLVTWDLSQIDAATIPKTAGPGTPIFSAVPPTSGEADGQRGLRFEYGQYIQSQVKAVTGLPTTGPFSIAATITPESKPDGYMGGIYESMEYMKSGLRLALTQKMQVNVEIYPGDGKGRYLQSKTLLESGKTYHLELKLDGQRAYLFINNRLDSTIDTPLPAPSRQDIRIGQASGKDYNFNGLISRVSISVPAS